MQRHNQFQLQWLGLLTSLTVSSLVLPAVAQITPDTTLGNGNNSVLIINGNRIEITGGLQRNSALFQSFDQFNVNSNQQVYFLNPAGVTNIFGRVTGGSLSTIDGLLGVAGSANLFLMNPSGIVFGPNARLDVAGSFFATTANVLEFPDGQKFAATGNREVPLVEVNIPVGLQFGATPPAMLNSQGNLAVGPGQNLTLAGGTTMVSGSLTAPGGKVEVLGQQVNLIDQARIDVSSPTGGGTVLVGGDYQGQGGLLNSTQTYVGPNVLINANATVDGNGGKVIVWSDGATGFYGNITSRGGAIAGNGGFVETSGRQYLAALGQVDAGASNGVAGNWLLDPYDIQIVNTLPSGFTAITPGNPPTTFTATSATNSVVLISSILAAMTSSGAATNVNISTGSGGLSPGNITVANAINFTGTNNTTLTLSAANNIDINAPISSSTGALNLALNATNNVSINSSAGTISTNGGNLNISSAITTVSASINTATSTSGGDVTISAPSTTLNAPIVTNTGTVSGTATTVNVNSEGTIQNGVDVAASGADITVGSGSFTGSVDFNKNVNLAFGGTTLAGGFTARGPLSLSGTLTTTAGAQSYQGTVTLTGATTLNSNSTIAFQNNVAGSGSLTITSSTGTNFNQAVNSGALNLTSSGTTTFGSTVDATSLTTNGAISINGSNITTTGIQNYTGPVTLGVNTTLQSNDNAVTFGGTISSSSANSSQARNLTIQAGSGTVTFNDAVGTPNPLRNLSVSGGAIAVNGSVTTNGSQSYTTSTSNGASGAITLAGDVTSKATTQPAISVNAAGTLTLQNALTVPDTETITLTGQTVNVNLGSNAITSRSGVVNILGQTINLNSGTINVSGLTGGTKASGGTVRLGGGLTGSTLSNAQTIAANGAPDLVINAQSAGSGGNAGTVSIYSNNLNAFNYQSQLLNNGVSIPGAAANDPLIVLNNSSITPSVFQNRTFDDIIVKNGASFLVGTNLNPITDFSIIGTGAGTLLIAQNYLQGFTGATGIVLKAANTFTIENLTNSLAMQTAPQFEAGTSFTMLDQADLITTGGRNLKISVGSLAAPITPNLAASLTVGAINTTGGKIDLSSIGSLTVGNYLTTATPSASSQGGNITIQAGGAITIGGSLKPNITTGGGDLIVESLGQGNLNITSNINTSQSSDRGGDVTLQANNGNVNLFNSDITSINSGNGNGFSTIKINTSQGGVTLNNTTINAANPANSASNVRFAGDVLINATTNINILTSSIETNGNTGRIIVGGNANATGSQPQSIFISDSKLTTTNDTVINGTTNSGSIVLRATNSNPSAAGITVQNSTLSTNTVGSGTGGGVTLSSNVVALTNSSVNAGTSGSGQGGSIQVEAEPAGTPATRVTLNSSRLNAQTSGSGSGGTIVVNAQTINLTNNSALNAEVQASGPGGAISVSTPNTGTLTLNNSRISTAVNPINPLLPTGNGNAITVNVGALALQSGARIQSQTYGSGNAGDIALNVQNALTISGANQSGRFSGVLASSDSPSSGAGGQITVNASNLALSNNGFLAANTSSSKAGGDIDVNVQTLDVQSGGQILTAALPGSSGVAGSITINATQGVTLSGAVPPITLPPSPFTALPLINLANVANQTVFQPAGGGFAYYAFNVAAAGSTGTFDIDGGYKLGAGSIDTQIFLFDRATGSLLATNDDSTVDPPGSIAIFSTLTRDSFLSYTFPEAGAYVLGVGAYPSFVNAGLAPIVGTPPTAAQPYTLNVNLSQPGVGPAVSSRLNPNLPLTASSNSLFASGLYASSQGSGNAGSITVNTPALNLSNQATITATTTNAGSTGDNITLNGLNTLTMNGGSQITASTVAGTAGNIIVNANQGTNSSVSLSDSTIAAVATALGGRAGGVTIATPTATLNNATITASNNGPNAGTGGTSRDITFQGLNTLALSNGSQISASTGSGTAGNVIVNAAQGVSLNNSSEISAEATDGGSAGGVNITTPNLTLASNSAVQVSSLSGSGTAGGIAIAANTVNLDNNSKIDAQTDAGGATRPANVSLTGLQTLTLNSSSISSSTNSGTAGNVGINASSGINLANNSSVAAAATSGGNAGSVSMTTPTLNVNNSSILVSSLNGAGTAGDITIAANTVNLFNNAEIAAETDAGGASSPANIFLNGLQTLNVDNSVISSATNQGTAGNLSVSATNQINLNNHSRLSVAATGPGGTAGSLNLSTFNMQVNQSDVTVSSALGVAGELTVKANRLTLNQGRLLAEIGQNSSNSKAGTITLSVDFRMDLENESLISTLGSNGANGGDISILNVRFLLGKRATGADGSDIIGRADGGGRGGRVLLDRSILVSGFLFRRATPGNRTNDIDTNGQLANFSTDADQGTRGLSAPVLVFSDVSELVTGACEAVGAKTAAANSGLQIAGRGGVPSSPTAPLSAQPSTSDWVSLELMPQVPVGVTFSDGSTVVMNPGETYELQSTCANAWKLQQQSNF